MSRNLSESVGHVVCRECEECGMKNSERDGREYLFRSSGIVGCRTLWKRTAECKSSDIHSVIFSAFFFARIFILIFFVGRIQWLRYIVTQFHALSESVPVIRHRDNHWKSDGPKEMMAPVYFCFFRYPTILQVLLTPQ